MNARLTLPAACLTMICACGAPRVSVRYPAADTPQARGRALAMSHAYLLVSPAKRVPNPALGKALKKIKFLGDRVFDVDAGALAARISKAFEGAGGSLLAYRISDSEGEDPFIERLDPTALLRVSLDAFSVEQSRVERKTSTKDPKTKKAVERVAVFWTHQARLSGTFRFEAREAGEILSGSILVEHRGELQGLDGGEAKRRWLRRSWPALLDKTAKAVVAGLGPAKGVTRSRTIFVDKGDPASKSAAKLAQQGRWVKAAGIWAGGLEHDEAAWRDLMNLGLASEREGLYAEAKRIYAKAKNLSQGDPAAAKIRWDEIFSDLDSVQALGLGRAEKARAWFDAPIAVLPFSDNTTSVSGPAMLREMVWKKLKDGGYAVLDLEDGDRRMRAHGYSMGGQLPKGKPAQFCKWTGAARLVFGEIDEFRNLMLGPLGKRIVAGELRLYDAGAERDIWSSAEPVVNAAIGGKESEIGNQIGRAFLESWMRKPLAAESKEFVRINLETLPLRPPKK